MKGIFQVWYRKVFEDLLGKYFKPCSIEICFRICYYNGSMSFAFGGDYTKKKWRVSVALLILFVLLFLPVFYFLWYNGVFISKNSAELYGESLKFNGKSYKTTNGENYTEGRTIAKDGHWSIQEIKEDPSHTFVVARSFLDQQLYVSEDYIIPTSGKITKVYWNYKEITDKSFLEIIDKINAGRKSTYSFETEGVFQLSNNQKMKRAYLAYENCPVANVYIGYLGTVNNKWVITTNSNETGLVECYEIPEEYVKTLERHFD